MLIGSSEFREVWLVDFEFSAPSGERPTPVCLVAWELSSGQKLRIWQDELQGLGRAPYPTGSDCLVVAYYASAELSCHHALGWPLPENMLDLYVEFRNLTNGLTTPCGNGLLGALAWHGLSGVEAVEKENMRQLVMRGGPYTIEERIALLDYCESDVAALAGLLPRMMPHLDMPRALLRGRYMKAAAGIEHNGVPIDVVMLERLKKHWVNIQDKLIAEIDSEYGVFDGRTFKTALFSKWLEKNNIPWPRLESGQLDLQDDTFQEMARSHASVAPIRELRVALSQMRLSDLAVGKDGRNRCLLSAFRARTGRNQPSNSRFIFGPSVWLRGLIRPEPGWGLAYVDWSQQEFGIAAALSGDPLMMKAYESGDPYLAFAKQAGAVPPEGTKQSHGTERDLFKACVLAVQYGMGEESLAHRIGQPVIKARELLHLHRRTYRTFWRWSDGALDYAMLNGKLWTTFGWTVKVGTNPNPRFFRNFLMQGNGSEMLRLACCLAIESGIRVCAPVHDAILIEAPLRQLEETITLTQQVMSDVSACVLDGFRLRTDAEIVRFPDRYQDKRGKKMWDTVAAILESIEGNLFQSVTPPVSPVSQYLCQSVTPVQSYIL